MNSYPSIETLYVREPSGVLDFNKIRIPEFFSVRDWVFTEKVDGTNIRVIVTKAGIEVKGRTEKAQLQPGILEAVLATIPSHKDLLEYFTRYRGKELHDDWSVTFYGEAYGPGIQKGGVYATEKKFIVFDVKLGSYWTDFSETQSICKDLDVPSVPIFPKIGGQYSSNDFSLIWSMRMTNWRKYFEGNFSLISYMQNTPVEGIVARPGNLLLDKFGQRVMWKMCLRDCR